MTGAGGPTGALDFAGALATGGQGACLPAENSDFPAWTEFLRPTAKENDYASVEMLQWFIKEQVEEEKNTSLVLDQLRMVGDKGSSLVMLDHRIGKRGD